MVMITPVDASDELLATNHEKLDLRFLSELQQKFDVKDLGLAHWYLEACIQQNEDYSIGFDQSCYMSLICAKFLPSHDTTNMTTEDKLKQIGLTTLVERRKRGDAIQCFKILQGLDHINYNILFNFASEVNQRSSRSVAEAKLSIPKVNTEVRRNFFSVRTCRLRYSMPVAIRQNISVHYFKIDYDMFFVTNEEYPPHYVL